MITIFLSMSIYFVSSAQSFFRLNWEKTYDINLTDKIHSTLKTSDGNFILAGETSSPAFPGQKIMLLKINPAGNLIWQKTFGNTATLKFTAIAKAGMDGLYLLGTKTQGTSNPLIWIAKTDKDGNVIWENSAGGGQSEYMTDLCETSQDGVFLCGSKEIKGNAETDGWLVKLNKKGVIESQSLLGSRYINDEFTSIISDKNQGFYIAGYTSEKIGAQKIPYILHIDFRGNKIWEKSYPEFPGAIPASIYFDSEGYFVCLMNVFSNTGGFLNISKMLIDSNGGLINSYSIKRQLNISRNAYVRGENDQIIVLSGQKDDPSDVSEKYIIKLDPSLNPIWIKALEMENISLRSINQVDNSNFISVGSSGLNTYKLDVTAFAFRDYSEKLIESYVNQKLIANAGMNLNESQKDFKARIGNQKFDSYLSQYTSEAITDLRLIPETSPARSEFKPSNTSSGSENKDPITDVPLTGKYFALLIAVEDYDDPLINDLDKPIKDAQKLFDVLLNEYLFETAHVTFLKNPSREQIISSLDRLEKEITKSDNLLIFYAGHGYWNETSQKGFWLPSDASKQNTSNWIANSSVSDYIRSIPAKHTLLIADACFSGSIFKTRAAFGNQELSAMKLYELTSRKAMTSGTLTEVPDKSVFIDFLVKRLYENQDKYLPSEQLFFSFKPAVLNNTESIPQYGVVGNAGDEGGDFIFVKRKK